MRECRGWLYFGLLLAISAGGNCAPAEKPVDHGFTDIESAAGSEHEVRFTSGKTMYLEGLVDGQWASRYWAADGRVNFAYWRFADPAFKIGIKTDPAQAEETQVSKGWSWVSSKELPRTDRGCRHFVVELRNSDQRLGVRVHTLHDGTPVFVRWLEIKNQSERPVALTSVAPWSARLWDAPLLGEMGPFEVSTSFPWMSFAWKRLDNGVTTVDSQYANGYDDPFFMARDDSNGEYFIGHLAWSANYRIRFACENDQTKPGAGLTFEIGPRAGDALRVLDPGETITTPSVHLGHIAGNLDETVQAMHEHIRKSVLPKRDPKRAWLIQFNTMGDQGYLVGKDFNEENIKKCIDVAAKTGCELFLLDCPWYDNYGDWAPSPTRFPGGMKTLVDYAHKKGLLFGLQTEVEGGRCDWSKSRIKKEHPDWFGDQNIMLLGKPEVAAYMESELTRVIKDYKPDLYRNEFIPTNSERYKQTDSPFYVGEWESTDYHGFKESNFWRHYENWGKIWDRIHAKYPDVVLQQCANCGTREDLGTIGKFDETNTSEGPPSIMAGLAAGKTLCIPPEIIEIGYGTAKERGPLDTCLRAMFTLSFPQYVTGIAPNPELLSPVVQERCLHYAKIYKEFIRPIMPKCKVYHHEPSFTGSESPWADPWLVMEFSSPDRTRGWATIIHRGHSPDTQYVFRPRGLRRDRKYEVTYDSADEKVIMDGRTLVEQGITLRLESAMSSELLLFKALEQK